MLTVIVGACFIIILSCLLLSFLQYMFHCFIFVLRVCCVSSTSVKKIVASVVAGTAFTNYSLPKHTVHSRKIVREVRPDTSDARFLVSFRRQPQVGQKEWYQQKTIGFFDAFEMNITHGRISYVRARARARAR